MRLFWVILFALLSQAAFASCPEIIELNDAQRQRLADIAYVSGNLTTKSKIAWSEPNLLHPDRSPTPERLNMIVGQLLEPDNVLLRQLGAVYANLASDPAELWNQYMRLYDNLVLPVEGYREIFERASAVLPKYGRFVDFGSGTGNGAAILTALEPMRSFLGIDQSVVGVSRAIDKFRGLTTAWNVAPARFVAGDLFAVALKDHSLDGAIMNNVLYSIPDERRVELLRRIRQSLKPGARLVLNDPDNSLKANISTFTREVSQSSLRNGSVLSELEFGLVGLINIKFLIAVNSFLTEAELKMVAERAGFKIVSAEKAYYGQSNLLVLENP